MKANAPERIWINSPQDLPCGTVDSNSVEYTRTDAFINKALKWYCLDCECNDNCKDTKCFFYREFERYLEGGTNALPPKFSNRILTEDGSTSNDWRYRHFTSKMQDAFIEKACEYFRRGLEDTKVIDDYRNILVRGIQASYTSVEEFIEDFKSYIRGE